MMGTILSCNVKTHSDQFTMLLLICQNIYGHVDINTLFFPHQRRCATLLHKMKVSKTRGSLACKSKYPFLWTRKGGKLFLLPCFSKTSQK